VALPSIWVFLEHQDMRSLQASKLSVESFPMACLEYYGFSCTLTTIWAGKFYCKGDISMKLLITTMVLVMLFFSTTLVMADDKAGKINLNKATQEQLMKAGISAELATSILELREENDEFIDIEELMDADGMDASTLRKLKKYFYIEEVAGCNC